VDRTHSEDGKDATHAGEVEKSASRKVSVTSWLRAAGAGEIVRLRRLIGRFAAPLRR